MVDDAGPARDGLLQYAGLAQRVEQGFCKLQVARSIRGNWHQIQRTAPRIGYRHTVLGQTLDHLG